MFSFGAQAAQNAPEFVPDPQSRDWLSSLLMRIAGRLGAPAASPRVVVSPPGGVVARDFDSLFDMICGVQDLVGQGGVELTLVEVTPGDAPAIPDGFMALGDPNGQMMNTLVRGDEYAMLYNPVAFKQAELLQAAIAREVGRIAIHRNGGHDADISQQDYLAEAELSAIALGLGVWIANGAYIFEQACCGGGCGIDLRSLRAGLSMPEASFATAVDTKRRGLSRRAVAKHLSATQKTAFKKSWAVISKTPPKALAGADAPAALGA
jgi:hypothetical protein